MARLSWPGWLVLNWGRFSRTGSCTMDTVTHPSTNKAWHRVTSLIETNALPLSQTTQHQYTLPNLPMLLLLQLSNHTRYIYYTLKPLNHAPTTNTHDCQGSFHQSERHFQDSMARLTVKGRNASQWLHVIIIIITITKIPRTVFMVLSSLNKKLSYCRDSARCGWWNGHSRSLKVIRCCDNQCGIYDFLLALNLTSSFNRSWDITPSLHIHAPRLFQVELEKDGWE